MTDNPLVEAVDAAIRQEIEGVSKLNGSSFCYEYDTGCMDFDGTFRPSEIATAALRAIKDAGWKVVPVKPTQEMRQAAIDELSGPTDFNPKASAWDALRAYRAMLAASPTPTAAPTRAD